MIAVVMPRFALCLILLAAMTLLFANAAPACPNCKDTLANTNPQPGGANDRQSSEGAGLPGGFNLSIYFMLGGVIVVGALVIRMIVRETRSGTRGRQPAGCRPRLSGSGT